MSARLFTFTGGDSGPWLVTSVTAILGEGLASAPRLNVLAGDVAHAQGAHWALRGVTSNERYLTRQEKERLLAVQPALGRAEATYAALIPIRKTAAWWELPQDERRRIFEESSMHVASGLRVLPAVARRLHHCRDLSENEPFDFLTWFEFAPADTPAFNDLVAGLRATEEWAYVDREVDIRLRRDGP